MSLLKAIKQKSIEAMKARDSSAAQLYKLALGEAQMLEVRSGREATDDEVAQIVRKLIKSNEETISVAEGEQKASLEHENELLRALLPKGASAEDIQAALAPIAAEIKAAKADGQATGIAMKHLKAVGFQGADGTQVAAAVRAMRA